MFNNTENSEVRHSYSDPEHLLETNRELAKIHLRDLRELGVPFRFAGQTDQIVGETEAYFPYNPDEEPEKNRSLKYITLGHEKIDVSGEFSLSDEQVTLLGSVYRELVPKIQQDLADKAYKVEAVLELYTQYLQTGKILTEEKYTELLEGLKKGNNLGQAKNISGLMVEKGRLDSLLENFAPIAKGMLNSVIESSKAKELYTNPKQTTAVIVESQRFEHDRGLYMTKQAISVPTRELKIKPRPPYNSVGQEVAATRYTVEIDSNLPMRESCLMSWVKISDDYLEEKKPRISYWYDIKTSRINPNLTTYDPYGNLDAVADFIVMYSAYKSKERERQRAKFAEQIELKRKLTS